jgi:biotin-(acetyl-CoA carboxylase) ligase
VQLASSVRVDDRCIAVGTVEESALVDVESATEVFRADRILDIDRSADGCTVASGSHVRGPDTDVTIDGEVSGLSDDGSTVLASGSGGAMAIVDVESGERTPLAGVTGYGGDLLP